MLEYNKSVRNVFIIDSADIFYFTGLNQIQISIDKIVKNIFENDTHIDK